MSWLTEAFVCVSVVHGNEVNVAEYEAFVVVFLQGLSVANIEQFGPVKRLFSILRDEIMMDVFKYNTQTLSLIHLSRNREICTLFTQHISRAEE